MGGQLACAAELHSDEASLMPEEAGVRQCGPWGAEFGGHLWVLGTVGSMS